MAKAEISSGGAGCCLLRTSDKPSAPFSRRLCGKSQKLASEFRRCVAFDVRVRKGMRDGRVGDRGPFPTQSRGRPCVAARSALSTPRLPIGSARCSQRLALVGLQHLVGGRQSQHGECGRVDFAILHVGPIRFRVPRPVRVLVIRQNPQQVGIELGKVRPA